MEEIWKDIPGFKGYYQASNKGRIKSLLFQNNVWNKKYKREKILKPKISKDGCSRVELWKDGKHKTYLTYRLVLCAFTDKPYEYKMTVNHKDGNRLKNNIENLEWLTRAENIKHAFKTHLMPYPFIVITDKRTNKVVFTGSKTKGSLFIGRCESYLSTKFKRKIYENDNYRWEYEKIGEHK